MAGTIVVDRLESDASYASSINIASPVIVSNTFAFPAGSASAPAISPTGDTNCGIFFPAADTIAFTGGGVESMRVNSDRNVVIGTTTPVAGMRFTVVGGGAQINGGTSAQEGFRFQRISGAATITGINNDNNAFNDIALYTSGTEGVRLTTGGVLCLGKTSDGVTTRGTSFNGTGGGNLVANTPSPSDGPQIQVNNIASSIVNGYRFFSFRIGSGATEIGSIGTNGSSSAFYATSSDYRLKDNIVPMTGALSKVAQLKPVTYKWKVDGSDGQGFIAHELQEVIPEAVTGEKDAVETYTDENGNEQTKPKYQGIDTSFLVATLTAAIQELKSELDSAKARITELENK